jgi:rubrerythrin
LEVLKVEKDKFNDIIDFAVEREKEAVQFYQDLQNMIKFQDKQELLKEFEAMEKSHIVILENIRKNIAQTVDEPPTRVENLSISDYLLEVQPTADMSYQDILIAAMKREEKAHNLYSDLANESADGEIKNLFLRLANEESKHKLYFEKLYDSDILSEN